MGGILKYQGFANFTISFFLQLLPLVTKMNNVTANFWFGCICLKSNSTSALYSKFGMEITCQFGSAKWFWACTYAQVAEAGKGCSKARKLLLIG
jgi:hypothetical protein